MKTLLCTVVNADDMALGSAERAVKSAFPRAVFRTLTSLEKALAEEPSRGLELLLLANPTEADVQQAAAAKDSMGLARWGVVVLGEGASMKGTQAVSLEQFDQHFAGPLLSSLMSQHQLVRENERMRGDMRTISHRIMHDLRTPLGAILAAAEGLKEVAVKHESSSTALAEQLFDSVAEMQRLMERVNLLLRASASPLQMLPVAMGDVVCRAMQRLERKIRTKGAVISQPADWPMIHGLPDWLETIWFNLISHLLSEGTNSVRIDLGWSQDGNETRFFIRGPGQNLPNAKIGTYFQPFHLLHRSNARGGLEFSLVQRYVDLLGGTCGAELHDEKSMSFFFTVPTGEEPSEH